MHTDKQPIARSAVTVGVDPTHKPRMVLKFGAAVTTVGFVLLIVAAALMPQHDAAELEVAFGAAFGDEKSQAIVAMSLFGSMSVTYGVLLLLIGGVWRMGIRNRKDFSTSR